MSGGTARRRSRIDADRETIVRRLQAIRLRLAVLVSLWSMTMTGVVLGVVGVVVARTTARPLADGGLLGDDGLGDGGLLGGGSTSGGRGGNLREQLQRITGGGQKTGLLDGVVRDLRQVYLSRALTAALVAVVVVGVVSGLAGWWLAGHIGRVLELQDATPRRVSPRAPGASTRR